MKVWRYHISSSYWAVLFDAGSTWIVIGTEKAFVIKLFQVSSSALLTYDLEVASSAVVSELCLIRSCRLNGIFLSFQRYKSVSGTIAFLKNRLWKRKAILPVRWHTLDYTVHTTASAGRGQKKQDPTFRSVLVKYYYIGDHSSRTNSKKFAKLFTRKMILEILPLFTCRKFLPRSKWLDFATWSSLILVFAVHYCSRLVETSNYKR